MPDESSPSFESLRPVSGEQWLAWLEPASQHMPELERAIVHLSSVQAWLEAALVSLPKGNRLAQSLRRFIGVARCPSALSCTKLAFRVKVIAGWLQTTLPRAQTSPVFGLLFQGYQSVLEQLYQMVEGADDRSGDLAQAVRALTRQWLILFDHEDVSPAAKAQALFFAFLTDVTGLVPQQTWGPVIKRCDREQLLAFAEKEVDQIAEMQPSPTLTWKSYDKRWQRRRLKILLTDLGDDQVLSELMRKSAVDDFEAAQAITQLHKAGRNRLAIGQGEQWLRTLPTSAAIAEALMLVYLDDGWDDEALELLATQHRIDPNPRWRVLLEKHLNRSTFPGE